jgi:hypothetical protein
MNPAVSFSSSTRLNRPGAGVSQLAELTKRREALSEKLVQASKSTPPPPSTAAADSIAREISGVKAQIEQIILEAQLNKLTANATPAEKPAAEQAAGSESTGKAGQTEPGAKPAKPDKAGKDAKSAPGSGHTAGSGEAGAAPLVAPRVAAEAAAQYGAVTPPAAQLNETV